MAGDYLTTGMAARSLGVSKGTVLSAVETGELHAYYRMPGGAYRFLLPEIERYAQWRSVKHEVEAKARAAVRRQAQRATAAAGAAPEAWVDQLAVLGAEGSDATGYALDDMLALVTDSLRVGATLVVRAEGGRWQITHVHD